MTKKCLFGGALLGASLVGNGADAQVFEFPYTYVYIGAYNYDGSGMPAYDSYEGSGSWSILVSQTGATAASSGNGSMIDLTAYSDDTGAAYAAADEVIFTVSYDTIAIASWDYAGDFERRSDEFNIDNVTDGTEVLTVEPDDSRSGSAEIFLEAGKEYRLLTRLFATPDGTGTTFNHVVIPAPNSIAVLALGGVIAWRRRR